MSTVVTFWYIRNIFISLGTSINFAIVCLPHVYVFVDLTRTEFLPMITFWSTPLSKRAFGLLLPLHVSATFWLLFGGRFHQKKMKFYRCLSKIFLVRFLYLLAQLAPYLSKFITSANRDIILTLVEGWSNWQMFLDQTLTNLYGGVRLVSWPVSIILGTFPFRFEFRDTLLFA